MSEPDADMLTPASEEEAATLVVEAAASRQTLSIRGGGTRTSLGRPTHTSSKLSSGSLTGISFHAPSEMVIAAKAGTPLREVEEELASAGQALTFEPVDYRALFGSTGEPTIGAVAAGNFSGPRRIQAGAARDSLIGIRMVNGNGELIKSGGRVMKNVTGLDLVKLVCGSFGTLGFLTEVVFKVLPIAEHTATLVIHDLSDAAAIAALTTALGSPFEPTGAAHLPAGVDWSGARTLIRVEGFRGSVDYRLDAITRLVAADARTERIDGSESAALWRNVRDATFLADPFTDPVWRISTAPLNGAELAGIIQSRSPGCRWFYDWGGGLIWLAVRPSDDADVAIVRDAVAATGGHATLVRAPDEIRAAVPVFEPQPEALMRLTAGIKASFDPRGVFEPGRMYGELR